MKKLEQKLRGRKVNVRSLNFGTAPLEGHKEIISNIKKGMLHETKRRYYIKKSLEISQIKVVIDYVSQNYLNMCVILGPFQHQ